MGKILIFVVLILLVARSFVFNSKTDKDDKRLLTLAFFLLVAVFGCRNALNDYGTDLNNYYRCFERAILQDKSSFFANSSFETGYLVFNWIIARIVKWPQFILFLQAAICVGITLRFIYKHSKDVFFSLLGFMSLGLMQFFLTGFRQSFAVSICLLALEAAENKKLIPFIMWTALATSIHQTAIVFSIVYILVNFKLTRLSFFFDFAASILLFRLAPLLVEIGNETFEKNYVEAFAGNKLGGLINIMFSLVAIFIIVKNRGNIYEMDVDDDGVLSCTDYPTINGNLFHVLVLGTALYALRYQALVLERISLYFTPTLFILLPQSIRYGFTEDSQRLARLIICFGLVFLIYWRMGSLAFIPFWK